MRIGFYAPLKTPDHPVPSGDRQMARALVAALRLAGHTVTVYSVLRSFARDPDDPALASQQDEAAAEVSRVAARWADPSQCPDLLFSYHLYYKAPDLLGPALAARFALPYVVAEASLSARRDTGPWADRQALVAAAVRDATLSICFTARDRDGLLAAAGPDRLVLLPPFLDTHAFTPSPPSLQPGPVRLIALAMMRPGDKLDSFRFLGEALSHLAALDWSLTVVGDGPARADVVAALAPVAGSRLILAGALPSEAVPAALAAADILAWPGLNEAYGLCYLEAQACGRPVVAVHNAGTPSVIVQGVTGWLTDPDPQVYATALASLIRDPLMRHRMAAAAAAFVHTERTLAVAAQRLDAALTTVMKERDR